MSEGSGKRFNKSSVLTVVLIAVAVVGGTADIIRKFVFGGGCLMKDLFNVPCPSCGMSRAFLSLMLFDIKAAFHFHPLFWIFPLTVALSVCCVLIKSKRKLFAVLIALCIAAYLITWVIRLITGNTV